MERRPAKFPRLSNIAPFNFKSGSKLIEITSQLQEVATKGKELGLDKRLPHIHGTDKDIKQIMELLFGDAPTGTSFDVIPIVGMGGIVQLSKTLAGKKFLLVLDDVWDYGHDGWNLLQSPFGVGAPGSKIIVTTRDRGVAKQMGMYKYHNLHNLSYDDCWLIFSQHAFQNRNIEECQELESIGKKIVENRCRGLPLAARALGSLLCCKQEEREWKAILNSNIWNEESGILPALKLSNLHLPSHLRTCISYCAIIPKDYEFRETELVLLSMAEGLIEQPKGGEQMEDLGCKYFHELVFHATSMDELPDSIGDLKRLRYLDVSHSGITRLVNLRHFDMTGVHIPSLEEMSLHIGKLTNLQTLPNFMVGKNCGRKIGELKNLSHIRGAIYISRLENVSGVKDARDANLMSKEELKSLSLEWDESHSSQNDIVERDVLDVMRPSKLLERLTINGYGSTKFPNWVGDVSFSKMVFMQLKGRKCCTSLPALGQLPLLKNLYIEGMSAIKRLDGLLIDVSSLVHPSLASLSMNNVMLPSLPALLGTKNMIELGSLTLDIRHVIVLNSLCNPSTTDEELLANEMKGSKLIVHLLKLFVLNFVSLKSLPEANDLRNLSQLVIRWCSNLEPPSLGGRDENSNMNQLTSLQKLCLVDCSARMVSYFVKEGSFPTNITSLEIGNLRWDNVGQLPVPPPSPLEWGLHKLSSLTTLKLQGAAWPWGDTVSFPEEGMFLPTSLIILTIKSFPNLERLSYEELQNLASLQRLEIWSCPRCADGKIVLFVITATSNLYTFLQG
ncbi:unnamed protein product [Camellia sinensis]